MAAPPAPPGPPGPPAPPTVAAPQPPQRGPSSFRETEASCNTTTFVGDPLLIIFYFTRQIFADQGLLTDPAQRDNLLFHIDVIRAWATAFNNDEPDMIPNISRPEGAGREEVRTLRTPNSVLGISAAFPVRTCVVIAPLHVSPKDPTDPPHITLMPSREYWSDPVGPLGPRWTGTHGGVHVYPPGNQFYELRANGYPELIPGSIMYDMWATGTRLAAFPPTPKKWDNPIEIRAFDRAIAKHIPYRGRLFSPDLRALPPAPIVQNPVAPPVDVVGFKRVPLIPGRGQIPINWYAVAADNPFFPSPGPMSTAPDGTPLWAVDRIVSSMVSRDPSSRPNGLYYEVRWTGWPRHVGPDSVYYPATDFKTCPQKVQEYHSFTGAPPPMRLALWHNAWMRQIPLPDDPNDNLPVDFYAPPGSWPGP